MPILDPDVVLEFCVGGKFYRVINRGDHGPWVFRWSDAESWEPVVPCRGVLNKLGPPEHPEKGTRYG